MSIRNSLLLLLLAGILAACSDKASGEESTSAAPATTENATKANQTSNEEEEAPSTPDRASEGLVQLKDLALPAGLEVNGEVDTVLHWTDREGEKYLVISELTKGEFFSEGYQAQLWASCHLVMDDDGLETLWEIKEFNQEIWEAPAYINRSVRLSDVDEDGIGETLFLYEIAPDGLDPSIVKLMFHVKGQKYAIRGQLAAEAESFADQEEKNFDPSFSELAPELKDYASQQWDDYRNWLFRLLNDDLTEEEIDTYRPKPFTEPEE